jgi:hypothetical protein
MGENNSGAGIKKADLLLLKVDRLAKQTATVDAKLNAVVNKGAKSGDNGEVIAKLSEENQALKQELRYLAAQTESVYAGLSSLISKLSQEIEELKKSPIAGSANLSNLDMDELSSKVAEKIIIPRSSAVDIDYNVLAARVAERISSTEFNADVDSQQIAEKVAEKLNGIDYDELGAKVVSNMYIPKAVVEEIDYDTLSDKIAQKINLGDKINVVASSVESAATPIDYDELGTKIVSNLYIPKAVVEDIDYDALSDKIAEKVNLGDKINVVASSVESGVSTPIDYDELGTKIVSNLYIPKAIVEDIDYDALSDKIAQKVTISDKINVVAPVVEGGAAVPIDYDELGAKIVNNMYIPKAIVEDIDYDQLAEKLSQAIPAPEVISPDYIASKVAEQIVVPQVEIPEIKPAEDIDIESLSRKIADKIAIPAVDVPEVVVDEDRIAYAVSEKILANSKDSEPAAAAAIDEQALAEALASKLNISLSDEIIADAVVKNLADAIDSEEIADCVAKKVGTIAPEQFDVMIDDDGCDSLAKSVIEKLDYDYIAYSVSEKLNSALMAGNTDIDTDELAKTISEKISVNATVNEDVIADKAAAVLSNYLPEIDTDDIADKVVAGVIPAIPAAPVIDYENISNSVSERIVESQEDKDFDIVIDDEGLSRITESVSTEIKQEYSKRFDDVDGEVENIKAEIENIKALIENKNTESREESSTRLDGIEGEIANVKEYVQSGEITKNVENSVEELKKLVLSGVVISTTSTEIAAAEAVQQDVEEGEENEELVTVSDIVTVEEPEELEEEGDVIDEIVDDIDENPTEDEIMPDGIVGISNGGVDFASMMKYNRSFIARIIQGSDDVKQYYGEVKSALLSYKKVNSNIAWGAERFNKGRETIARFKIRGKTLCLYLALDPNEYKESVYHHSDVSDNKSMHGTPMMVKIKSPLGVKKAIRLIDEMLEKRNGIKQPVKSRDYAAMYPYESMEALIEDGLVKDVSKNK